MLTILCSENSSNDDKHAIYRRNYIIEQILTYPFKSISNSIMSEQNLKIIFEYLEDRGPRNPLVSQYLENIIKALLSNYSTQLINSFEKRKTIPAILRHCEALPFCSILLDILSTIQTKSKPEVIVPVCYLLYL